MKSLSIAVRPLASGDQAWVQNFLLAQAGATRMVSRGVLHQCEALPGFIADYAGVPSALTMPSLKSLRFILPAPALGWEHICWKRLVKRPGSEAAADCGSSPPMTTNRPSTSISAEA